MFQINVKKTLKLSGLLSAILLVACGGSDNSNNTTENKEVTNNPTEIAYATITGTAFAASALTDASVTANCKDNAGFKTAVKVDAQGKWQGQVDSSKLPCRLEVKANEQSYHSYISQAGNININPLTDLTIAYASTQVPTTWYQSGVMTDEKLKSANTAMIAELIKKDTVLIIKRIY